MNTNDSHNPTDGPSSGAGYQVLLDEVDGMFDDVLMKAVIDTKTVMDTAYSRVLVLTNELDRRQVTETEAGLSTTSWLAHQCRMSRSEASGTVKTARSFATMPKVAEEAVAGAIVTSGVKLLTRARDRHPDAFPQHEAIFAKVATYLNPRDLRRAVAVWDEQVDFEGALDAAEHDAERRELFMTQTFMGRWDLEGRFGVADGHVINTALRGYIQASYIDGDDRRSMPQRLADAAIGIHRFWLDHTNTVESSGGEKPHITITVPYEILTRNKQQLPELDGYTIDPETVRRWACDAGIVRIVTCGESQPLDVGRRTRTIPPSLRRAIELRDGGCTWEGCQAPVSWCDIHHIIHWADGGDTSLTNCTLLCRKHHTLTHKNDTRTLHPPPSTPPQGDTETNPARRPQSHQVHRQKPRPIRPGPSDQTTHTD